MGSISSTVADMIGHDCRRWGCVHATLRSRHTDGSTRARVHGGNERTPHSYHVPKVKGEGDVLSKQLAYRVNRCLSCSCLADYAQETLDPSSAELRCRRCTARGAGAIDRNPDQGPDSCRLRAAHFNSVTPPTTRGKAASRAMPLPPDAIWRATDVAAPRG